MMKTFHVVTAAVTCLAVLTACSSSSKSKIDPESDPDLLSRALEKVRFSGQDAERKEGDLPAASNDPAAPSFALGDKVIEASKGDRVTFPFSVSSGSVLTQLFAKVVGAPDFFEVTLSDSTKLQSDYSLGFGLPNNVLDGTACFELAVRDDTGLVGRSDELVCVEIVTSTVTPTAAPTPTTQPTTTPTTAPTVTPTPVPGGDGASACFNPDLLAPGTQIMQRWSSTNDQGSAEFTDNRSVVGNTNYDGRSALETTGTTNTTLSTGESYTTMTTTYTQVDSQVPSINTIGVDTDTNSTGSNVRTTTTITPGRLQRFNLNAGQNFNQTFNQSTTVTVAGVTETYGSEIMLEIIYEGREMVTVDAGTFNTCVFVEVENGNGGFSKSSSSSRNYIDVVSGLLVKSVADGTFNELLEATINGNSIR